MGVAQILGRLARYGVPASAKTPPFLPPNYAMQPDAANSAMNNEDDADIAGGSSAAPPSPPRPMGPPKLASPEDNGTGGVFSAPAAIAQQPTATPINAPVPPKRMTAREQLAAAVDPNNPEVQKLMQQPSWKRQLASGLLGLVPGVNNTTLPQEVARPGITAYNRRLQMLEQGAGLEHQQELERLTQEQRDITKRNVQRQEKRDQMTDERDEAKARAMDADRRRKEGGVPIAGPQDMLLSPEDQDNFTFDTDQWGNQWKMPTRTAQIRAEAEAKKSDWPTAEEAFGSDNVKALKLNPKTKIDPAKLDRYDKLLNNAQNPNDAALAMRAAAGDPVAQKALDNLVKMKTNIAVNVANARSNPTANEDDINRAAKTIADSIRGGNPIDLKDAGASMRNNSRLKLFNAVQAELSGQYNPADVKRKLKMLDRRFNGDIAKNLQSFDTFLQHAGGASDAINTIRNTNVRLINKPINWWKQNMAGDPAFASYLADIEPVQKELMTFLLSNHALQKDDRERAQELLNGTMGLAESQEVLRHFARIAKDRLVAINQQFRSEMGNDLTDFISPEAEDAAAKFGVNMAFKPSKSGGKAVGSGRPPLSAFER